MDTNNTNEPIVYGKYYFASDFHLGAPNPQESLKRERKIVAWLDEIKLDATELFILGDVFDFWFEYKSVVPRGYVRLLGKLAELSDSGILIHWFKGNHDMWIFDYLPEEINVQIHSEPLRKMLNGKQFYIGHGDGLGPGDKGYKLLKKIFASPICQWLFARLHPNLGIAIANSMSSKSRNQDPENDKIFLGKDKEWLALYCESIAAVEKADYYVFGHRHLPMKLKLSTGDLYMNIGDWISNYTYAVLENTQLSLRSYGTTPIIYSNTE